jgi:hypothetical protein
VFAGAWVCEAELDGVQPLTFQAEAFSLRGVSAVEHVADTRMVDRCHVDADLVCAAGFQVD